MDEQFCLQDCEEYEVHFDALGKNEFYLAQIVLQGKTILRRNRRRAEARSCAAHNERHIERCVFSF